jgi:hypothetical protein
MNTTSLSRLFLAGAAASFAIAALHLVIIVVGAPGYRYFGAPQLATLAEQGSARPALLTLLLAAVFAVWGLYGLSGAGRIRRLPLLRTILVAVAAIYLLRGLLLVPEIVGFVLGPVHYVRGMVFSFVSLCAGLAHLCGLVPLFRAGDRGA